jgi:hypothetical protein
LESQLLQWDSFWRCKLQNRFWKNVVVVLSFSLHRFGILARKNEHVDTTDSAWGRAAFAGAGFKICSSLIFGFDFLARLDVHHVWRRAFLHFHHRQMNE